MGKHCAAVELLLARMDSNPEEFTQGGRWDKLIAKWKPVLSVPDRMALESKLNTLWLEVFHKDVMNELLAETREDAAIGPSIYQTTSPTSNFPAGIAAAVPTITNTTANLNLSRQSIKEIAAQLQSYASNTWKP